MIQTKVIINDDHHDDVCNNKKNAYNGPLLAYFHKNNNLRTNIACVSVKNFS